VQVAAGVSSDQLFVSRSTIFMSDMLGNRRFIASLDSVSTFSNFDFLYLDMHKRLNWGARLFDNRSFYLTIDESNDIDRQQTYRETGLLGLLSYPFTRYHRLDGGAGYMNRNYFYPRYTRDENGNEGFIYEERSDSYPFVSTTFSGDSAVYKYFGPVSGRRYQINAAYAPDTTDGGTLSGDISVDWREYFQISSRTLLAARLYAAWSDGNAPNFYYFGGLNTLRGYDFRTLIGQHAGFANFELRFPLVDVLATPIVVLQQLRGVIFFDIGAAAFDDQPFVFQREGRLVDGKASVGWGFNVNFWGMQLNWDFAKRFDGKDTDGELRTSFWVGQTF
jgi:outer membrane protein assembly factor BamA